MNLSAPLPEARRRELGPADGAEQHGVDDRLVGMGTVELEAVDADLGIGPLDHDLGREKWKFNVKRSKKMIIVKLSEIVD